MQYASALSLLTKLKTYLGMFYSQEQPQYRHISSPEDIIFCESL